MLKEGRSTLLCARRERRNRSSPGCMLGIFVDNLSSTFSFDKGQSMNLGLLSLCRRTAAIVIGCRYRLRLRYIESARNPADKGSREVGKVSIPVSNARPSPAKPPLRWTPVRSAVVPAAVAESSGVAESPAESVSATAQPSSSLPPSPSTRPVPLRGSSRISLGQA